MKSVVDFQHAVAGAQVFELGEGLTQRFRLTRKHGRRRTVDRRDAEPPSLAGECLGSL